MDRIFRVFVSGTFKDLHIWRSELAEIIWEWNCIPTGMEIFPAANETAWSTITKIIDASDFVILLLGHRYGQRHPDHSPKSYTHVEYEYAMSKSKPVAPLIWRGKDPTVFPPDSADEHADALADFIALVEQNHTSNYWTDRGSFNRLAMRLLKNQRELIHSGGFIPADSSAISEELEAARAENERLTSSLRELRVAFNGLRKQLASGNQQHVFQVMAAFNEKGYANYTELPTLISPTWDQLYIPLARRLRDERHKSRGEVATIYRSELRQFAPEGVIKTGGGHARFTGVLMSIEQLDVILNQFVQLGFIKRYLVKEEPWYEVNQTGVDALERLMAVEGDIQADHKEEKLSGVM